ncbi:MAG: hypothetical protein Q8L41_04060 [Anaerolineales bacterium]|nr:hypothetical protein [Anaerolineales bacterium]
MTWLSESELQADALDDLRTKSNELSIFHINQDTSNLNRVVAALAISFDDPSNFDFALLNEETMSNMGIKWKRSPGVLSDKEVNDLHSDLYELSDSRLLELARTIKAKAIIDRKDYLEVLNIVAASLANGHIDRSKIRWKKRYLEDLDILIASRSR